jgi:hypothetical protein
LTSINEIFYYSFNETYIALLSRFDISSVNNRFEIITKKLNIIQAKKVLKNEKQNEEEKKRKKKIITLD